MTAATGLVKMKARLISRTSWPSLPGSQAEDEFALPYDLQAAQGSYTAFYAEKHEDRNVKFHKTLCTVTVKLGLKKCKATLTMDTVQCVLARCGAFKSTECDYTAFLPFSTLSTLTPITLFFLFFLSFSLFYSLSQVRRACALSRRSNGALVLDAPNRAQHRPRSFKARHCDPHQEAEPLQRRSSSQSS